MRLPAPKNQPLDMQYDAKMREVPQEHLDGLCHVRVTVKDERQNKETVGLSFRGALLTTDMRTWVANGLSDLRNFGAEVDTEEGVPLPAGGGVAVEASLTRAYIWQVGFKIFSMVALKARFSNGNGLIQEKYYRAHGDKTNMWGADSEYVDTLNYGMNNLVPVMAQDLVSLCRGVPVEQYSYAGPPEKKPK